MRGSSTAAAGCKRAIGWCKMVPGRRNLALELSPERAVALRDAASLSSLAATQRDALQAPVGGNGFSPLSEKRPLGRAEWVAQAIK